MLRLELDSIETYDDATNTFITIDGGVFTFEHSLRAISEWESKYMRPFLTKDSKTPEELYDYVKMMCYQESFEPYLLDIDSLEKIQEYMNSEASATTIVSDGYNSKIVTSEVLYAYMAKAGLDISLQDWHISRLFKVLAVVGTLSQEPKKMTHQEIREQNRLLNKQRQEKLKTKG